ncbi:hypothetical protein GCM10027360_11010 [Amycolatopsis echigonensis]
MVPDLRTDRQTVPGAAVLQTTLDFPAGVRRAFRTSMVLGLREWVGVRFLAARYRTAQASRMVAPSPVGALDVGRPGLIGLRLVEEAARPVATGRRRTVGGRVRPRFVG